MILFFGRIITMKKQKKQISLTPQKEQALARVIRNMHFEEYVDFVSNPWRTFWFSFLKGTGMGLGALVGVTIVILIINYVVGLMGGIPILRDLSLLLQKVLENSK